MDIQPILNNITVKVIQAFGDAASRRFYEELKNHRFMTTRCKICRKTFFYPRVFCPFCLSQEIEWVNLSGKGKLYAFTQQEKALRFMKPDVVGIVELEGCIGRIFTKIEAPFDDLTIGMDVEVSFLKLSEDLTLHKFRPVKPPEAA